MGELIDLRGLSIWHEVQGDGQPVVLLHGGLTNGDSFSMQMPALVQAGWKVHVPDRRGHGRSPDTDAPFSYSTMADETTAYLEDVVGGPAHVVGYSDGANTAMLLAIARPDLVRRVVLMSGNFHHDGLDLDESDFAADDPTTQFLGSVYGAISPNGLEHWPVVLQKTLDMFRSEPTLTVADLAQIVAPTLVLAADDDLMFLSHTTQLFEALPDAQLAIVPGASHLVVMEQPDLVNQLIVTFLDETQSPVQLIPRRRPHFT